MGKKLQLECTNANHICDKSQYNEATLLEKIKLSFHLLHCKACRTYTKGNIALTKLTNKSEVASMPANNKQSLKDRLAEEMAKQNQK